MLIGGHGIPVLVRMDTDGIRLYTTCDGGELISDMPGLFDP